MAELSLKRRKFSVEEYLMVERAAGYRSEMLDGEIYAMSGASPAHVIICTNLSGEVYAQLKGSRCQGMSHDMKVPAGRGRLYSYPDYLILCAKPRFHDDRQDILLNPQVLFEVLSPSTEDYDRTTKFDLYKQIESLREYVLIELDEPRVEHYVRTSAGSWTQRVLTGMDAALSLQTVSATVALSDLYAWIEFKADVVKEDGIDEWE